MDTTYSTIASLLPFNLVENKPGLNPNEFTINGTKNGGIELTIIPNNVFYLVNPDPLADAKEVRNIKVPVPSIELAQSIINDYTTALLGANPPEAAPGLLAVAGDWTDKKEFGLKFIKEIAICRRGQNKWFQNLVDIADDTWAKTQSPIGISDLQRSAARMLELKRAWINPLPDEVVDKCPICRNMVNPGALKCVACGHVLNKVEYEKVLAGVK